MMLLLPLYIPLLGMCLIIATGRWSILRDVLMGVTTLALLAAVCVIASLPIPALVLPDIIPGIHIGFAREPLGALFMVVASGLWVVTSLYSIGYMRAQQDPHQTRFHACFALSIMATMGVALASNLFTLFIFYELLTLATYPLVTHSGCADAKRAGRVYLGILLTTSIGFFLTAIIWTWVVAGTLDFTQGGILNGKLSATALSVLLGLYIYGIGKAALMPLHRWLPAAMVAPAPVSALLHAVAVVKAGVFTVLKVVVGILGVDLLALIPATTWFMYIAGATIVLASFVALKQDNLKRLLAYSTISQLSYVVMGALLLAPKSLMAAGFHIAAHAVAKITLFFAAGAIYTTAHKTKVSELQGIGKAMPVTMVAFTIAALSMIGLPPAVGFWSKFYLLQGAWQMDSWYVMGVLFLSSVLNAFYFIPLIVNAFRGEKPAHGEAEAKMIMAMVITAAAVILLFAMPDTALQWASHGWQMEVGE